MKLTGPVFHYSTQTPEIFAYKFEPFPSNHNTPFPGAVPGTSSSLLDIVHHSSSQSKSSTYCDRQREGILWLKRIRSLDKASPNTGLTDIFVPSWVPSTQKQIFLGNTFPGEAKQELGSKITLLPQWAVHFHPLLCGPQSLLYQDLPRTWCPRNQVLHAA